MVENILILADEENSGSLYDGYQEIWNYVTSVVKNLLNIWKIFFINLVCKDLSLSKLQDVEFAKR